VAEGAQGEVGLFERRRVQTLPGRHGQRRQQNHRVIENGSEEIEYAAGWEAQAL